MDETNNNHNFTRERASKIADAIIRANFEVYGIGNFDISYDELVNIVMIIANFGDEAEGKLKRYYKMLSHKHMPSFHERDQHELRKIEMMQMQENK